MIRLGSTLLGRGLVVLLLLLAGGGGLVFLLLQEAEQRGELATVAREYTQATGGLGLGSSLTLEWSARHLDPTLERASNCDAFPLPGGPGFCPDQTSGLFSPPDELEGLPVVRSAGRADRPAAASPAPPDRSGPRSATEARR